MAELVDAHDSKSCREIYVSSSLTMGTRLTFTRTFRILYKQKNLAKILFYDTIGM